MALPILIKILGISTAEIALMTAIPTYIGLSISLIAGPLVDFIGRKRTWIFGNLLPELAYLIGAFTCRSWIEL